jgi:hypothetical protein
LILAHKRKESDFKAEFSEIQKEGAKVFKHWLFNISFVNISKAQNKGLITIWSIVYKFHIYCWLDINREL